MPSDRGIRIQPRDERQADGERGDAPSRRDRLRQQVRGMSWEESQEALSPDARGSVTVVAAAGSEQVALEGERDCFTPTLSRALLANPEQTINAVLGDLSGAVLVDGQLPTLAQGEGLSARPGASQHAVVVSNADYLDPNLILHTPHADGDAMSSRVAGRGFDPVEQHQDKTAQQMKSAYEAPLADGDLQRGDSLFLYYAGHGVQQGLLGVNFDAEQYLQDQGEPGSRGLTVRPSQRLSADDILRNQELVGVADRAAAAGVNTTVVLDSCHSGAVADTMRRHEIERLAQGAGENEQASQGAVFARLLQSNKDNLISFLTTRYGQLDRLDSLQHQLDQAADGAGSDEAAADNDRGVRVRRRGPAGADPAQVQRVGRLLAARREELVLEIRYEVRHFADWYQVTGYNFSQLSGQRLTQPSREAWQALETARALKVAAPVLDAIDDMVNLAIEYTSNRP